MALAKYYINTILSAGIAMEGLQELKEIVEACPFCDPMNIPIITLTEIADWRRVCENEWMNEFDWLTDD